MHEQLKFSLENQLNELRNQRTASNAEFDEKIRAIEKQLGLEAKPEAGKDAAAEFQKQRDAAAGMKSPFTFGRK